MRRTTRPPARRAASQAIRNVRACPRCSPPVGDGASRPMMGNSEEFVVISIMPLSASGTSNTGRSWRLAHGHPQHQSVTSAGPAPLNPL